MNGAEYTYVPVKARTTTYAANGDGSQTAGTTSGYYIWWDPSTGFTGSTWQGIESELQYTGFKSLAEGANIECTYSNFLLYVNNQLTNLPFPGNLNNVLGDGYWANGSKIRFIDNNISTLGIRGNVPENDPYYAYIEETGCIEAL